MRLVTPNLPCVECARRNMVSLSQHFDGTVANVEPIVFRAGGERIKGDKI